MFKNRSEKTELMDDLSLDHPELEKNLNELIKFNILFGSTNTFIDGLNQVYVKYKNYFAANKIFCADLGCASGDLLQAAHTWLSAKKIDFQLIGIDANAVMISQAKAYFTQPNIVYHVMDIFSNEFTQYQFDIVTLNSITHHFNDINLITLITQLSKQTRIAIIINDLHRHFLSYVFVKYYVKILKLSSLAQHDAPLSILRAFRKSEFINILRLSHIKSYQIKWKWPFRWQIIIWLKN